MTARQSAKKQQIQRIQPIIVNFLYYTQAINMTMLHALDNIGLMVGTVTVNTQKKVQYYMNFAACNPARPQNYTRHISGHKNAQSQAGGYHYYFLGSTDHTLII